MVLLQIAEPGQSQAPHQHRLAVGIDLGTTNSLVAAVRSGSADVLPDESGNRSLPSVVHYQSGEAPLVGHEDESNVSDALSTIRLAVAKDKFFRPMLHSFVRSRRFAFIHAQRPHDVLLRSRQLPSL